MTAIKPIQTRCALSRLSWLLHLLAGQVGRVVCIQHLAKEYEISSKTLYRDLDWLRDSGAVVTEWGRDENGAGISGLKVVSVVCPFCSEEKGGATRAMGRDDLPDLEWLAHRNRRAPVQEGSSS